MRRGDIYWVNFDPAQGSEANKKRPAVIVSRNEANAVAQETGRGTVTVVPLTTNTRYVAPFHVFLPAVETRLRQDSKAQAEQIRTISVNRIGEFAGFLTFKALESLDAALRLHLNLN